MISNLAVMTNEPTGNFVISADIYSDGKIALYQAVLTDGVGAHGKDAANGPDGLFSQGSVEASTNGKVLAVVNVSIRTPLSSMADVRTQSGSNTVSLFAIDQNRPAALSMLGQPMSSGGEFPISLAFNKAGSMLCVLNGGAAAGVKCFSVDAKKGLSGIANTDRVLSLNQTTPATGPAGSASHITFNDDDTQLIASIKGTPPQPGFLAIWDVTKDYSLSIQFRSITPAKGGLLPFALNLIPGKNAVFVADPTIGFDIIPLSGTSATAKTASSANSIPGQKAVCWSSHSTKTGSFYVTDAGTSLITEVAVDENLKAKIVEQYQQTPGSATIDSDIATVGNHE
jgi:hypothetical protein